ncbi:MAG TPA: DUF6069 family protein [Thermomicrobiales bacterium]|nr:DUF6069 family protein [Thermomicrobiales bacterium]
MNSMTKPRSVFANATRRPIWQLLIMAVGAALVVNVIILALARAINGGYPVATIGGDEQTIGFAQVIVVTLLVGTAASSLLMRMRLWMPGSAKKTWTIIALIVFAISLLGPLSSGVDTASKISLLCLHIGTAVTIIPLMRSALSAED